MISRKGKQAFKKIATKINTLNKIILHLVKMLLKLFISKVNAELLKTAQVKMQSAQRELH